MPNIFLFTWQIVKLATSMRSLPKKIELVEKSIFFNGKIEHDHPVGKLIFSDNGVRLIRTVSDTGKLVFFIQSLDSRFLIRIATENEVLFGALIGIRSSVLNRLLVKIFVKKAFDLAYLWGDTFDGPILAMMIEGFYHDSSPPREIYVNICANDSISVGIKDVVYLGIISNRYKELTQDDDSPPEEGKSDPC